MIIEIRRAILLGGFILLLSVTVSSRPNTNVCRTRNGKFPRSGTSCKGYYECKNYVPAENTCPDNENFNAYKQRCDWEELYPCLERPKDKECLKENGLFLKPGTNCKNYYRCCNGKAKMEVCPDDLLFDPSRGNCEWPDLYTCIESLSTTEKVSSTVTIFETTKPSLKTSTDPAVSKRTIEETTPSNRNTSSTQDPDFNTTNSRILESSTKLNTQPTSTDGRSTVQTSETSTVSQTKNKISTSLTTEISPTSEPKEISTTSMISTSESMTSETSTLQPATTGFSTLQPISEISTMQPTTSEVLISQTSSPQMSSTHFVNHTISKENKEGELTEPISTARVTTSTELNIGCPQPNGNYPHPTDQRKFISCSNNIPYIFDCPSNLVYKHHVRRCEHE